MKILKRAGCLAVALAALATTASPATAASSLRACFNYPNLNPYGLSTNVERYTGGRWVWFGAPSTTNRNGCVRYTVYGSWRHYSLRIAARAGVPAWGVFASGATRLYGPAGGGRYDLGTWRLNLYSLPASAPAFGGQTTSTWLGEMDRPDCRSSTAMQVACYMDAHGLHGNVVVLDYDRDGRQDGVDDYPRDPSRW